jgi:hypothetical protein
MEKKAAKQPSDTVAIEDDERHSDDVGRYLARNRDALNVSIKRSRAELAKGNISTKSIDDIIKHKRPSKKR